MQIFKVIFLSAIGILILIIGIYLLAWKPAKCYTDVEDTILAEGYSGAEEKDNLIILCSNNPAAPNDNDIKQLEEKWNKLKPEVVLIEGKEGFLIPGIMDPVEKFGISGKAHELALKNNVEIFSYSLPDDKIVQKLRSKYSSEQIALAVVLNSYIHGSDCAKSISRDNILRACIYNQRRLNLDSKINSVQDIDRIWERDFPGAKNWRTAGQLSGYAGEIADELEKIKHKHYLNLINHFLKQNKKIFVVGNPVVTTLVEAKR